MLGFFLRGGGSSVYSHPGKDGQSLETKGRGSSYVGGGFKVLHARGGRHPEPCLRLEGFCFGLGGGLLITPWG